MANPSLCGYSTGDPTKPRTANVGYECTYDSFNSLWGFCSTTAATPADCGTVGTCVDFDACQDGCGILDDPSISTVTW